MEFMANPQNFSGKIAGGKNFKRSISDTTGLDYNRLCEEMKVIKPLRPLWLTAEQKTAYDWDNDKTFGGIQDLYPLKYSFHASLSSKPSSSSTTTSFRFLNEQSRKLEVPMIVAFINSKAGGGIGDLLKTALNQTLHEDFTASSRKFIGVVCDLSKREEPAETISRIARELKENEKLEMKLVVCGGDGTVTWILSALEQCQELKEEGMLDRLPVAIVPLGTGNDLARSLGWGKRLKSVSQIVDYLEWVVDAVPVDLDQWQVALRPHSKLPENHRLRGFGSHPQLVSEDQAAEKLRKQMDSSLHKSSSEGEQCQDVYIGFCQNYFSIGMTAKVAISVDQARSETCCGKCFFRCGLGQACYAVQALKALCTRQFTSRVQKMHVLHFEKDGGQHVACWEPLTPSLAEAQVHCSRGILRDLMFVNINSMSGGHMALPGEREVNAVDPHAPPPKPADDSIEVHTWGSGQRCDGRSAAS